MAKRVKPVRELSSSSSRSGPSKRIKPAETLSPEEAVLSANAREILRRRYLNRDLRGNIIETPRQMFERVARAVASAERFFHTEGSIREIQEEFFQVMASLEFLPNTPCLINAGTRMGGQLAACFVLPVKDSLESIFDAVKHMSLIHQSAGGTGFDFSRLRPKGDLVGKAAGTASGPVSFMWVFDAATEVIKQGGRRRGANIGILRCDHPDILEFIRAKEEGGNFPNFNFSVAITEKFMKSLAEGKNYELINPRTQEPTGRISAKEVFDLIAECAWKSGDPGLLFIDEINRHNPTPKLGRIEATNPCGEAPLLAYEACVLGSINLSRMVGAGKIKWSRLEEVVRLGVRFLDNVIEINRYPLPQIEEISKANRKIGLGVMGFAEMLIRMEIPYDSEKALETARKVMRFISKAAREESERLAEIRGVFPNYEGSIWEKKGIKVRNASLITIAPTGTISAIAGTSSGIEPLFAVAFTRNILGGRRIFEINNFFQEIARKNKLYSEELMKEVVRQGSIQDIKKIPTKVKKTFVTAFDIAPAAHVKIQAAVQAECDNGVSKTINFPEGVGVEDIKKAFLLAYKLKCKGITAYRYGSKAEQVLYLGKAGEKKEDTAPCEIQDPEYSGGCPEPYCLF